MAETDWFGTLGAWLGIALPVSAFVMIAYLIWQDRRK